MSAAWKLSKGRLTSYWFGDLQSAGNAEDNVKKGERLNALSNFFLLFMLEDQGDSGPFPAHFRPVLDTDSVASRGVGLV
jgi:hypothetical protein